MAGFSAQGPMLGYLYQARYALYKILQREENYSVKIEGLDDITFESNGKPKELLQTKHRAKGASLSNTSVDLWKTIRIWSEYIINGKITEDDKVLLVLITTADIKPNNTLAEALLPKESKKRNVTTAVTIMDQVSKSNSNKSNKTSYERYRKLNAKQKKLLANSITIVNSETRIEDLDNKLKQILLLTSRQEFVDDVLERIEGWWFNHTILHLNNGSNLPISKEMILNKLHDIRDEYNKDNLPIYDYEFDFDSHEIDSDQRPFVEQLRLISLNNRNILKAVNDYMNAYYHRSQWVRKDLIFDDDIRKYEDRLIEEWERLFDNMVEDIDLIGKKTNLTYIESGRTLYRTVQSLDIHIRKRADDPFIMRGSYQILANELRVGWHLEFEERLKSIITKAVGE
ncbi:hypothetical protein KGF86_01915 [Ornithinibacillus massiliensis]|uniref:ABC-three component systems C-terminal domain-containing protein n=1 Tax=Ornithinibacillus massiliensis TaxID=1944633 RepID=A0ABS5M9G4_9BACI|nr:ABC-three component system protein [Ornithinibacillus massiliensis]MBS3678959.1 hypothetical protein [Ornithinibacillus massiliensis]